MINSEQTLSEALARGEKPPGPVDHDVPVLAARDPGGTLRAVAFGYACHNTTLSILQWCGDYAGFAQIALEQRHPGATALFHMGCGADQNPLPRRTVELCQQYGTRLAAGVDGDNGQVELDAITVFESFQSVLPVENVRELALSVGEF